MNIPMKQNKQQGFTLIEVIAAAFVLSVAVASLFLVSARSLVLNSQATKTHGAILLAEDVFAGVQRALYDNVLDEKALFEAPFNGCKDGKTCQMKINAFNAATFPTCGSECQPVVRAEGTNFFVQDVDETDTGVDTGYEREIRMTMLTDAEMKVSVTVRWQDRARTFEKTYERTFVNWYDMGAYSNYGRVILSVVECPTEADLPNWAIEGQSPAEGIVKDTAVNYVDTHPGCFLSPDWKFQWGFLTWGHEEGGAMSSIDETRWVENTAPDLVGEADGSGGPGTDTWDPVLDAGREPATNEWRTFGDTDIEGRTAIFVPNPADSAVNFALRFVMKEGYVPFSHYFDDDNPDTWDDPQSDYSAEMYCDDDIINFDNYERIQIQPGGNVYYCTAFVAPVEPIDYGECLYFAEDGSETLVALGDQFLNPGWATTGPIVAASVPAGDYRVTLQAHDYGEYRIEHGDQPYEQYYVSFLDSSGTEIARTGDTQDIPDGVADAGWAGVVNDPLSVPSGVASIQVKHSHPALAENNSMFTVCMHLHQY